MICPCSEHCYHNDEPATDTIARLRSELRNTRESVADLTKALSAARDENIELRHRQTIMIRDENGCPIEVPIIRREIP